MADLRTDYKDDVLNINTNERRKYRMINNADGTISFEDVTDYVQNGDSFGSSDLNAITERVNRSLTGADVVENLESTATDLPLSANMGREMYANGIPFLKMTGVLNNDGSQVPPNAYKDSAMAIGYAPGVSIGLNVSAYIPIITTRWYEASELIRTTQLAITGTGLAVRYSTSEVMWSEWTYK